MAEVRCDTDGRPFLVPASVTRDELNEALDPLYKLLNITKNHVFDEPGIIIGFGRVTFAAPSPKAEEDWAKDRPPANVTHLAVQGLDQGGCGEQMQMVHVQVTDPAPAVEGAEVPA